MANGRYRPRKQLKFWLYTDLKNEHWLIEVIEYWKSKRQFSDVVKSGLRLMWSLGQGQTDVLFELFPQLETQLAARYAPPTPPDTGNLERQIADLKRLILEQGSIIVPSNQMEMKSGGTLGIGKTLALPTFDDDDMDTVVLTKATGGTTNAENFMASMANIAY